MSRLGGGWVSSMVGLWDEAALGPTTLLDHGSTFNRTITLLPLSTAFSGDFSPNGSAAPDAVLMVVRPQSTFHDG